MGRETGRIERLTVYPVKGLDAVDVEETRVLAGGTLERDREFALYDAGGSVINGKRTDRVHELRTEFDTETGVLTVRSPEHRRFELDDESGRERAARWFEAVFGVDAELRRAGGTGFVDRPEMGPSVISTATLREVASWFEGMDVESARRRLRANVEVGGVEPFWEDRFVGEDAPSFVAGDVRFEGVTPCGRCVVPERDPETGEPTPDFRERFVDRRRETFPDWADPDAFDHFYSLMTIARVPEADRGSRLRVGDPVRTVE